MVPGCARGRTMAAAARAARPSPRWRRPRAAHAADTGRGRGRGDAQVTAVARRDVKQGDAVELDPADAHAVEPDESGPCCAPGIRGMRPRGTPHGRGGPDAPQRACERSRPRLAVLERAVVDVLRERRPLVGVERGRAVERARAAAPVELRAGALRGGRAAARGGGARRRPVPRSTTPRARLVFAHAPEPARLALHVVERRARPTGE